MKLLLITIIDWIDDKIIRHRFYGKRGGLCYLISNSNWWEQTSFAFSITLYTCDICPRVTKYNHMYEHFAGLEYYV